MQWWLTTANGCLCLFSITLTNILRFFITTISKINIFHEVGRGNIFDESGQETSAFVVEPSLRLKKSTDPPKYVKNKQVTVEVEETKDTEMTEAAPRKERASAYNIYSDEDRRRYFYFIQEKLMKPSQAAKVANVNYNIPKHDIPRI